MSAAYSLSICPWRHGLSTAGVFRFLCGDYGGNNLAQPHMQTIYSLRTR